MAEDFEMRRWCDLSEASSGSRVRTKNGRMYRKAVVPMASNRMRGVSIRRERVVRHRSQRNVRVSQTLDRGEIDPRAAVRRVFKDLWGRRKRRNSGHQE